MTTAQERQTAPRAALERFTTGQRVTITAPTMRHRPFAGRGGRVVLVNESGSAWVRVEKPQGHRADHCFVPGECSAEVGNG